MPFELILHKPDRSDQDRLHRGGGERPPNTDFPTQEELEL